MARSARSVNFAQGSRRCAASCSRCRRASHRLLQKIGLVAVQRHGGRKDKEADDMSDLRSWVVWRTEAPAAL